MANYTVLYNPYAGNGRGTEETRKLKDILSDDVLDFCDITTIKDYAEFFRSLPADNRVVVSGGDGTLNCFINNIANVNISNDIYYFATGSGNDFLHDTGREKGSAPFCINSYIKNLPEVTVDNRNYKFLNGIGYGIDGYCCEVGDIQRNSSKKSINYTAIAIKGLLFHYKPTNAVITVDGQKKAYKKVWLAPTMNGRFYGGGMMPTPKQNRLGGDGIVSTLVFFGSGKLRTLMIFPSIFKGEHVKQTKFVEVLTGRDITVEFDRPTSLQIDGETILGVTKYRVTSSAAASAEEKREEAV